MTFLVAIAYAGDNPKNLYDDTLYRVRALEEIRRTLALSGEKQDFDIRIIIEAAKRDLEAVPPRREKSDAKLAIVAQVYEERAQKQLASQRAYLKAFLMELAGGPTEALRLSYVAMEKDYYNSAVQLPLYLKDRSAMLQEAVEISNAALVTLANAMGKASPELIDHFRKNLNLLTVHYADLTQAVGQRFTTTLQRAKLFQASINRLMALGAFAPNGTLTALNKIIAQEGKETIYAIYVNRDTVNAAISAAGVAALGATFVVNATATVATSAVTRVLNGLSAVEKGTRVAIAGSTVYNLVQTIQQEGAMGLLSPQTALDLLTLIAIAPTPMGAAMKARNAALPIKEAQLAGQGTRALTAKWLVESWHLTKAAFYRGALGTQYQAAMLVPVGSVGLGLVQLSFADKIARDIQHSGGEFGVDAKEIRRQAIANITIGLFSGFAGYSRYRSMLKKSEYAELVHDARLGSTFKRVLSSFQKLLPWKPVLDFLGSSKKILTGKPSVKEIRAAKIIQDSSPTLLKKNNLNLGNSRWDRAQIRMGAVAGAASALGRMGYNFLFYQTLLLLAFSYPDDFFGKGFDEQATPLPDLEEGEIALVLAGFSKTDPFYGAIKTAHSNDYLARKYIPGQNYFRDDFHSPSDLLAKLEFYGKTFGKIKYLEIRAHGLPGIIAVQSSSIEGQTTTGKIDAPFMEENRDRIRKVASLSVAPGAIVRVWSCLVGANLSHDTVFGDKDPKRKYGWFGGPIVEKGKPGQPIPKENADHFLKAFGETFLHQGGVVDSSRFTIAGISKTHGSAFSYLLQKTIRSNVAAQRTFEAQVPKYDAAAENTSTDTQLSAESTFLEYFERIKETQLRALKIVHRYGLNVEGSLFSAHHRRETYRNLNLGSTTPDIATPGDFWKFLQPNAAQKEKILRAATLAAEILNEPRVLQDYEVLLSSGKLIITAAENIPGNSYAKTYAKPNALSTIVVSDQLFTDSRVSPTSGRRISIFDKTEGAQLAGILTHEWIHTCQKSSNGSSSVFLTEEDELQAYDVEIFFYESLLRRNRSWFNGPVTKTQQDAVNSLISEATELRSKYFNTIQAK